MVAEKRRERRIGVNLPMQVTLDGAVLEGKVKNISRLGAYFELNTKIPVGAVVDFSLEIPSYVKKISSSEKLKCSGEVFRSVEIKKGYGIGVFFINFPDSSDRNRLSSYLDFLVQVEDKNVQKGLKYWDKKRVKGKNVAKEKQSKEKRQSRHDEIVSLLQQVLDRLDEVSSQLKSSVR